jgi:hypothetical protein
VPYCRKIGGRRLAEGGLLNSALLQSLRSRPLLLAIPVKAGCSRACRSLFILLLLIVDVLRIFKGGKVQDKGKKIIDFLDFLFFAPLRFLRGGDLYLMPLSRFLDFLTHPVDSPLNLGWLKSCGVLACISGGAWVEAERLVPYPRPP